MNDGTLKVTKIEDHRPQAMATHTISYQLDGFQITSVIETATPIRQIIDKLKSVGAEPLAAAKPEPTKTAPTCPTHPGRKMKASTARPGTFYCTAKDDDGEYCRHKA